MRRLLLFGFIIPLVLSQERSCSSNICLNGGTCKVDDVTRSFRCYCSPGFAGTLCQDVCSLKCANGVCVKGDQGREECKCHDGWSGTLCEVSGTTVEGCVRTDDCPPDQRCIENDRGFRICMGDPCDSKPCRNNATCKSEKDDFRCECPLGFGGKRCEADVNECELSPCRNGGTCLNLEGSFECLCSPRFKGFLCADPNSACLPDPCQNDASCVEMVDDFHCLCASGFAGKTCNETVVAEGTTPCSPSPCLNGGKCLAEGSNKCLCAPNYTGINCDEQLECTVGGKHCLNGGSCVRGLAQSYCKCPTDYGGILCETLELTSSQDTNADVCTQKPCLNGGTCRVEDGVPVCICATGFNGPSCGALSNVSACDPNPCQNGGYCEPAGDPSEGGFTCECILGFEGYMCELEGSEWEASVSEITPFSVETSSSTTNQPTVTSSISIMTSSVSTVSTTTESVSDVTHQTSSSQTSSCEVCVHAQKCLETENDVICICEKGFSGKNCDQNGEACDTATCTVQKVCRQLVTSNRTQTECRCEIGKGGAACQKDTSASFGENSLFIYQSPSVMIGSSEGPLPYSLALTFRTTVSNVHIASGENIFGQRLFSVFLIEGRIAINVSSTMYSKLLRTSVNDGMWYSLEVAKTEKDLTISLVEEHGYRILSRSLPRLSSFDVFSTRVGKLNEAQNFVGCIADVSIDKSSIDVASSSRGVEIGKGCSRTVQCTTNVCHNGGTCIDLWNEAKCECKPPFLPPLCLFSLPPSTFGHKNLSSLAEIGIPPELSETLRFSSDLQLIVRSNKPSSSIFFLGEGSVDDVATFISLQMENGTLAVRSRAGGKAVQEIKSTRRIDDNQDHVIRIERKQRHVKLYIDSFLESEGDIPSRFNHPMFVEKLLLGSSEDTTEDAYTVKDYFKGSVQDVRVNGVSAVLHNVPNVDVEGLGRINRLENVLEGSISDDICSRADLCVRGSCHNTFNDFECSCELGYYGRHCDQKDYCITSPCPASGNCQNVGGGYICTSPATFVSNSRLGYELESTTEIEVESIEFSIRTHSEKARILSLNAASGPFLISLVHRQLVITTSSPFTIRKTIADGKWNHIEIRGNIFKINNASYGLPHSLSLPSKFSSASLILGSAGPLPSFEGCIQSVKVGELPKLSFYREDELQIPKNLTYWKATERKQVTSSCLSSPQCGAFSPCLNNAECVDEWNTVTCKCAPGFKGSRCETNINECRGMDCGHGYCIDGINDYRCQCDAGFTGLACDVGIDFCTEIPCKNNGICEVRNGTFSCECTEGWTGNACEIELPRSCSPSPCQNGGICQNSAKGIWCRCRPGFSGNFCEISPDPCSSRPCQNGVCHRSRNGYTCTCEPGYTGQNCVEPIDFCTRDTCGGKGTCRPVWNSTFCSCDKSWRGANCDQDVDECVTIPCQNDAKCVNQQPGFGCQCRKYYMGDLCEVEGSCLTSPCKHGECIQLRHDEHSCSCHSGYEGMNCEKKINYCKLAPCRNGATCESLLTEYQCHCIAGFNGTNCENDIDECASGYCSNGSVCRDRVNDYECMCEGTGYKGKNCTEDIDECALSESCINGECTNTHGGYKCDCEQGFIGKRCSLANPCIPDQLNRTVHTCMHGICINPAVKIEHNHEIAIHDCECDRGYGGSICSTKVEERRLLALSYILGPVIMVLVVLCLLGCTLFFFVWRGKRALHGHYSPSHQEMSGARVQMSDMIKLPPAERLI